MSFITDIKVIILFQVPKHIIENESTTMELVPPKALNSLVVATFTSNKTSPSRSSRWVGKHKPCNVYIFHTLVSSHPLGKTKFFCSLYKKSEYSICFVVGACSKEHDSPRIAVNATMDNKLPSY